MADAAQEIKWGEGWPKTVDFLPPPGIVGGPKGIEVVPLSSAESEIRREAGRAEAIRQQARVQRVRAEAAEGRIAEGRKLVEEWRSHADPELLHDNSVYELRRVADQLETALGSDTIADRLAAALSTPGEEQGRAEHGRRGE